MRQSAIYNEFEALCIVTELSEHEEMLEGSEQYSEYNRYGDILPYRDTRVKLNSRSNDVQNDYINACFVDVRRCILIGDIGAYCKELNHRKSRTVD
jgi:protein tyrosine phosphatase